MSLKPGVAKNWLLKYHTDVYPRDEVILRGKKMRPPKYYDNLLLKDKMSFEFNPYDEIIESRVEKALLKLDDNTPDRLAVRESVQIAQIRKLVKTL